MELPHIGQTCIVCNRNDYLPFRCTHCDKIVCIDHKTNHGSKCPLNNTKFEANSGPQGGNYTESLKQSCDFCGKITLKLELTQCLHCQSLNCLYHRHQIQHNCKQLVEANEAHLKSECEKSTRRREALDKLRKITTQPPEVTTKLSTSTIQPRNDSQKSALSRRVRIMSIKQSARGPSNILDQDKLFFEVKFQHQPKSPLSASDKEGARLKIFTSAKHTVGRMIDWSAEELGIANQNHKLDASQLVFVKMDGGNLITMDSQVSFATYIDSGQLDNGDELILTYTEV